MFYRIKDNKLFDYADYKYSLECLETDIITRSELMQNPEKVVIQNGEIAINPEWEEIAQQKERERIGNLKITKRVFALALQNYGISYTQLKGLIATNEQAQLEWDLCVELERKNPLLDIMAAQLCISSETLDYIFKKANGEVVELLEDDETPF
ncbi:hypothetical protein IJ531_03690 [bacterium]|nr:hypothetical protein [bacterium]